MKLGNKFVRLFPNGEEFDERYTSEISLRNSI